MSVNLDVIGGSGFIGTRLVNRLKAKSKYTLSIIDKAPSLTFPDLHRSGDVTDPHQLMKTVSENSIIINLAAEHRDDVRPVSLYDSVNIDGAHNICAAAIAKDVKMIVFTSSVAVYGFAPLGTDESGKIAPFNEYGRTKYAAEQVYKAWQNEDPDSRTLVIIRPTVVFGERNRGNVYNLLRQIASGKFVMVGNGLNCKSMAYVENVVAFIEHSLGFNPGVHVYNYIDKPDFTMNELVAHVRTLLGKPTASHFRIPYAIGYAIGRVFDGIGLLTGRKFTVSSIRVKKFCANSVFNTAVATTGFTPPVSLHQALEQTVRYEFIEPRKDESVFYTE